MVVLSAVKSVPVVVATSCGLSVVHLLARHALIEVASSAWYAVLLHIRHSGEVVL